MTIMQMMMGGGSGIPLEIRHVRTYDLPSGNQSFSFETYSSGGQDLFGTEIKRGDFLVAVAFTYGNYVSQVTERTETILGSFRIDEFTRHTSSVGKCALFTLPIGNGQQQNKGSWASNTIRREFQFTVTLQGYGGRVIFLHVRRPEVADENDPLAPQLATWTATDSDSGPKNVTVSSPFSSLRAGATLFAYRGIDRSLTGWNSAPSMPPGWEAIRNSLINGTSYRSGLYERPHQAGPRHEEIAFLNQPDFHHLRFRLE
jgi:hypothetical protein